MRLVNGSYRGFLVDCQLELDGRMGHGKRLVFNPLLETVYLQISRSFVSFVHFRAALGVVILFFRFLCPFSSPSSGELSRSGVGCALWHVKGIPQQMMCCRDLGCLQYR